MKVVRQTSEQLVIESRPWLVAVILLIFAAFPLYGGTRAILVDGWPLFGLGILIVGALFLLPFFWAFIRRNQLILDRSDNSVILRRNTISGYKQNVYNLSDLEAAEVQKKRSNGGSLDRLALRFSSETRPFVDAYSSESGAEPVARAVNDWLTIGR